MLKLLSTFCVLMISLLHHTLAAQEACALDESLIVISLQTDRFGYETSWSLQTLEGEVLMEVRRGHYANNRFYEHKICVPVQTCLNFTITDSYGDGIASPGFFRIEKDDELLLGNQAFERSATFKLFCETGETCTNPTPILVDQSYRSIFEDHWYQFTPDSAGLYMINTCSLNSCDTKIWVYDSCEGNGQRDDNAGTIFFNNDTEDCGVLAHVQAYLQANKAYLIRIGDEGDDCVDPIHWELNFMGPVIGCTDPNSCNYNPLATISDGSCLPLYDPACPQGPDLAINEELLVNSIKLDSLFVEDVCLVEEQCVRGYGRRDIVRFDTEIHNLGQKSYFLGSPTQDNDQFTWNNCHNHFHFENYAEYIIYDAEGQKLPGGFKNGFCVMDLACPTGEQQFTCDLMGISPGCLDRYWAELECQWIDVTDLPDGMYTLVTRINWKNAPDYLGQYEETLENNWAQVCIYLDRSTGKLELTVDPNCDPYMDCAGQPYGPAQADCEGNCNGTAISGDIDGNGVLNALDLSLYIDGIMSESLEATPCLDLSGDGEITIYDAALLKSCLRYGNEHIHSGQGLHDHCEFPAGIQNKQDSVELTIQHVNYEAGFIDLAMKNPTSNLMAFQVKMDGFSIIRAESLVDSIDYPVALRNSITKAMVAGLSFEDATIRKSDAFQPLCRIHFFDMKQADLCLEKVIELVNEYGEQVTPVIRDGCVETGLLSGTNSYTDAVVISVQPNPAKHQTKLLFPNPNRESFRLEVYDTKGQKVYVADHIKAEQFTLPVENLPTGHYYFRLTSPRNQGSGKLMVY